MEKFTLSPDLFSKITNQITDYMGNNPGPYYAAFDADGTLWDSDMGEQFFQYKIDNCNLERLKNIDPWEYYESTKKVDPIKAYLWLAQITTGHSIDQVQTWAKEAVEHYGAKVFESQKKLISWLHDHNIETFIVTASIQWAVEPAAHLVGIDSDHVLGIKTKINEQGLVTDEQDGPITWRQGKADALLARTNGARPIFCSGNTYGDIALIESSACAKLAVQTQVEENSLFEEESKLREHAKENQWDLHHFFNESV